MRIAVTLEISEEKVRSLSLSGYPSAFMAATPNRAMRAFDRIRPYLHHTTTDLKFEDVCTAFAYGVFANEYEALELLADAIVDNASYFKRILVERHRDIQRRIEMVCIRVEIDTKQRTFDENMRRMAGEAEQRLEATAPKAAQEPVVEPRRLRLRGSNRNL